MFDKESAIKFIKASSIVFEEFFSEDEKDKLIVCFNDTWAWACADSEEIEDHEIIEVATLLYRYGRCGVLYWCSKKRGGDRSEFADINRVIEFVEKEERVRKEIPGSTKRAYHKVKYEIGEEK